MKEREQQVLDLIREDPLVSQQAIADRLGISRSAVAGHVMRLTARGVIKGRGYVFTDKPFVVSIGGANLDIHGRSGDCIRAKDSNPGIVHACPGGVARNVAENLARLGADCRLVTAIGDDQPGETLMRSGRAAGIDMQHVVRPHNGRTSTYVSVLDNDGEMQVAISDMRIIDELGPDRLRALEPMMKQAALVVLDTNLSETAIAWLSDTLSDRPLFADTVSTAKAAKIAPFLDSVHTLTPSLIEAEAMSGISLRTNKQFPKLASWFHDRGVSRVFITLGERGVFYSTEDACGFAAPPEISARRNTGGAGDAFLAGLAWSWLQQWDLRRSVEFSLATAGITLGRDETSSPALTLAAVRRSIGDSRVL